MLEHRITLRLLKHDVYTPVTLRQVQCDDRGRPLAVVANTLVKAGIAFGLVIGLALIGLASHLPDSSVSF